MNKIIFSTLALVLVFAFAGTASAVSLFYQGFEVDTSDWFDYGGTVTRVPSGTDGITSSEGSWHGSIVGGGAYSRFDGYRDTWNGEWFAEIDIYLDPSWATGEGFDYSVAASKSDGGHLRDFIFHVGTVEDYGGIVGKKLLVNGSNNADFYTNPYKLVNDNNGNYFVVDNAGWYTLQHRFYDNGGSLAVDLNLLDSGGTPLWTSTRTNAADTISTVVGGNRYAWFTHIDVTEGIAVDAHELYDSTVFQPTGEIIEPEEDEIVSGETDLIATYDDGDEDDDDAVNWAVRSYSPSCNGVGNLFGGGPQVKDVINPSPFTFDGKDFNATIDTTLIADGRYCFVFNPTDDPGQNNVREVVGFYIDNDADGDGVLNDADKCPGTSPEGDDFPQWGDKKAKNRWMFDGEEWITKGKEGTQGGFGPTLEDTLGCSGEQILDAMSEATGEDFGGHYKFGLSKSIIEDWIRGTYYVGPTFVETVEVPANANWETGMANDEGIPTESNVVLETDTDYFLQVYGTAFAGDGIEFDADYSYRDASSVEWTDLVSNYEPPTWSVTLLDLIVDGTSLDWGTYNPDHEYENSYPGTGSNLELMIEDVYYKNNTGSIFVDIIEDKWIPLW